MINHLKKIQLLALIIMISACSNDVSIRPTMYDSSLVTPRKITLNEEHYIDKKQGSDITYNYLMGLSNDYDHHGNSPLYVVLGYNPDNRSSKLKATNQSSILKGQLAKLGMRDAVIKTMPIQNSDGEAIIAYDRVIAKGPENCGAMPGIHAETGSYGPYGMGCTLKSAMAKQIAYPKDLMGQSDMGKWGADRTGNAVNRDVRSGEISPFVPSYVLSELAGNSTE